jgi:hypothetical protein
MSPVQTALILVPSQDSNTTLTHPHDGSVFISGSGMERSFRASGITLGDSRERQITAKPIV